MAAYVLLGGSGPQAITRERATAADVAALLRRRTMVLFLLGSVLVWATVTGVNTFLSIHLVALGADGQTVGLAWALGAVIEVPLMFAFPAIARRIPAERLLVLGALVFALKAVGFAVTSNVTALVLITLLGGIGFALYYVGTVTYVARVAPARLQATARWARP